MKKNLLRYLSVITLFALLVACEEDDKITDNLPPEDGINFSIKPLQLNQTTDLNGNTYFVNGTLVVDADISASAPEGFSQQVLIQIVKWEDGEEIEVTKGAPFNLSGNGVGDSKTFNLDFNNIIEQQTELNLAANILEAGSLRKIKGRGIVINAETDSEDAIIPYKIKSILWDTAVDNNNDGFFASRNVTFIVATEGDVEKELTGNVFLINDSNEDTTNIFQTGQFTVRREGFSNTDLSFDVNIADTLIRSSYEFLMQFYEFGNTDDIVFEVIFKAADFVRIGFEPAIYDNREYFLSSQPGFTWVNQSSEGYFDTLHVNFDLAANVDLDYTDIENSGEEFGLRAPFARLLYKNINDPEFTDFLRLGDTTLSSDPFQPQTLGFYISDLIKEDSGTYDFIIQIMEPSENYFNSTDAVPVIEYTKEDFATLGGVKISSL